MANISLPGAETTVATNWKEHLSGDSDKVLEAEWGLAWEWETPGGPVAEVGTLSWILPPGSQGEHSKEDPLVSDKLQKK